MKKPNKKKAPNLLDLIPHRSSKYEAKVDEEGMVTIFVENKGFFNFVAQKLFKKPRISQIHLEEFGSFIWQQIDEKRTVQEIGVLLKEKFGEKAEPLYPRLSMYINTLVNYEFIQLKLPLGVNNDKIISY